ncbi:DUF423 domain-containing protein [Kaistia algarum]|nr:DUF423 domain-containing protein [Kaistia algarum]
MEMLSMNRSLVAAAGLAGAIGVAFAAAGSHIPGAERMATAGSIAMAQAPALLTIGLLGRFGGRLLAIVGWVIAAGLLAFAGSLAFHDLTGSAALAFIAPIGGTVMILGWLGFVVAAVLAKR